MASINKRKTPRGKDRWLVRFDRKPHGRRAYTFDTEEDAKRFVRKWEEIYAEFGASAIPYDRVKERQRREFGRPRLQV